MLFRKNVFINFKRTYIFEEKVTTRKTMHRMLQRHLGKLL